MRTPAMLILATSLVLSGAAAAQEQGVVAKLGGGRVAKVSVTTTAEDGVLLEIEIPGATLQSFPRMGLRLISIGGNSDRGLIARDLDRDGIDEIILRGVVPQRSALVVLRWDASTNEYAPVDFTDDRDRTSKFMIADPELPVRISASGEIEAEFETTRQDGRKSHHVARYKWDGRGYAHSASN